MASLFLASLTLLALLYAPGFLLFKALHLPGVMALAAAPIASAAAYGFLPIIYDKLGISCNVIDVVLAPLAVFAFVFVLSWTLARHYKDKSKLKRTFKQSSKQDWLVFALYLACGIIVCSFTFIANLGAPDAFFSRYDNQTHLNLAQSFADSGTWSALDYSRYGNSTPNQNPYLSASHGFYPVTWHILIALSCLISGAKVTVASNALVAVLAAIIFPAGMFVLMRALFPKNKDALIAGAFACVSFASYPWVFPLSGPTLPNMLGFALMAPAIGVFVTYCEEQQVREHIIGFTLFVIIAFVGLAISHTSALFTAFVFIAPYGAHIINKRVKKWQRIPENKRGKTRVILLSVYLLFIIAFWAFCLKAPLLQGVVGFHHREHISPLVAAGSLGLLGIGGSSIQYAMVAVVIIGIIVCIKRRILWLLIPAIYMSIGYFVARVGVDPFVTIFMGLWYSLPYRAAGCLSVFLMPIAALGLETIWRHTKQFAINRKDKIPALGAHPAITSVAVMVILALVTFAPFCIPTKIYDIQSPFNSIYEKLNEIYAQDSNRVYGAEEVAFVNQIMEVIPEGALVLNSPNDGSLFSYGVNHLNAYYRSSSFDKKSLTNEAKTICTHLDEYARNLKVQKAVAKTGAQYVLQLDQGVSYEDLIKLPQFYEKYRDKWAGIDRIRDDTPGFSVVLSNSDMRLYRIDSIE